MDWREHVARIKTAINYSRYSIARVFIHPSSYIA